MSVRPLHSIAHRERTSRTRAEVAAFILREAAALGMAVGTDGCDLIIAPPRHMPRESYFSFQRAIIAYRNEIIDLVLAKGAL
jgi:hypothetical protein